MIGRTPNTFIVGAGRLATALAGGLRHAGVPVLGLWARRPEQARNAGAQSGVAAFSSAPPDLLLEANVVILAVSDGSIAAVARTLIGTGLISRSHVLVHCSGALSADEVFGEVRERVGGVATMHPLRSIADPVTAMRQWSGCVFGLEGDERGRRVAADLINALGGQTLALEGNAMAAYHAAAATASNYLVALLSGATQILATAGIDGAEASSALVALMRGTLENIETRGAGPALTGPIRRGDVATIERHLEVLKDAPPLVGDAYRAMGRLTVELARTLAEADSSRNEDPAVDKAYLDALDELDEKLARDDSSRPKTATVKAVR